MKKDSADTLKTWVEIDMGAVKKNYKTLRSLISKKTKFMTVVKSNAYGHGIIPFSKIMQKLGADFFGVDDIDEALALRKNGITRPVLVFGHVPPARLSDALKNNISITISNFQAFKNLDKIKNPDEMKIHLKIDTGLGRQGFLIRGIPEVLKILRSGGKFRLEGLYTHFAGVESRKFKNYTENQIAQFMVWKNILKENGFKPMSHVSPSAGILAHTEYNFDMVRAGIASYGLWPSAELKNSKINLAPALSWKTVISETKVLPKGSKIGYDLTEALKKETLVGIAPVGYWHGYPRSLSGVGEVIVRGKRAKVLGRVSMDMIALDLSKARGAKAGDEAVLIGRGMSADELAHMAGTISYELVTRINSEIPRIYI